MIGYSEDQGKPEVRTAGIDPALIKTGFCAVVGPSFSTVLIHEKWARGAERLSRVAQKLRELLDLHRPELLLIEGYSYNSNGRLCDLGEMGGVFRLLFFEKAITYRVVPPALLKHFATGNGLASKERVMREFGGRYGLTFGEKDDDLADAAVLARMGQVILTGASTYRCELEAIRRLDEMEQPRKADKFARIPKSL